MLGICASFLERDWRLALGPYDLGVEAINQIFCAVSHAALEALADQWKTRKVARYLAQSQAARLLSSGSVQEGATEASIRRRNEDGGSDEVRGGNRTLTRCRSAVGRIEDSDVMPGEISSERPPERRRKVKKNLRDSMLSLGLVKWLKASVQEAPQVSKDGELQKQGTVAQTLTRARASEVVGDSSRTGGVGHAGVVVSGTLGKRARRGAGGPAEEEEIMSQYEWDRIRRMKRNKDFMRSLGIEMGALASKSTTAENRGRRRTSAGVVRKGTARVGRTIRTQSAEPRDAEHACLPSKEGRSFWGSIRAAIVASTGATVRISLSDGAARSISDGSVGPA